MRDGKKLAVDILKVTDGKKYPVILELTPYGRFLFLEPKKKLAFGLGLGS